jgi:16S rRNA (cytosine967-C5)-methyltransferase
MGSGSYMVERSVEVLIDFTAYVLHNVVTRKVSHDIAFQLALERLPKAPKLVPIKLLYRASRSVVSYYYTLRYVEQLVYGSRGGARRLARLWLLLLGDELKELLAPLEQGVRRLKRRLARTMPKRVESLSEILEAIENPVERLAVELSYPTWFVEKMVKLLGLESSRKLLEALNEEQWWIRVNTLKTDVDQVIQSLEEKGVIVQRDPDLPYMLRVVDYAEPLHHLEEMWRGEIIFQDKASAMVVEALDPQPGDVILDLAAAPGVKDTLILQLASSRVRIIAVDVSWERTRRMRRLLSMYSTYGPEVDLVNADSTTLSITIQPTKILLDAPCTSTGAIGKDPAIKIHLEDPRWVSRFPVLQENLLRKAMSFKGAEVVYATCSLLAEEGEEQVAKYANALEDPKIPGSPGYHVYSFAGTVRRFFPHVHLTQGFFIAKLRA